MTGTSDPTPPTRRYRYPQRLHVKRTADFDRIMKEGHRVGDRRIMLWALPNDLPYTRLGLAVGRKHGHAVRRNRIKRLLREAFRLSRDQLPAGYDLVCVPLARGKAALAGYCESFVKLAARVAERSAPR
jgi:ribonuclease P protein component